MTKHLTGNPAHILTVLCRNSFLLVAIALAVLRFGALRPC